MPLYSIQRYVDSVAQTLVLPPSIPGDLETYVTPPPIEKITGPRLYTWGGRVRESRQAGSRGPGLKKLPWSVDLWLTYMDTPDDAMANEPFPQFVDAVMAVFRATVMPVFIDSQGAVIDEGSADSTCSQIQQVGENMDLDYPPERSTNAMRMLWYQAHISLSVLEVIQA